MRELMEETFLKEGGLALSLCDGGLKLIFGLMKGGYDLVLGHISPISQPPPLQLIIAQSLTSAQNCPNTPPPPFLIYHAYFI